MFNASETPAPGLGRRDVLALVGTAAAAQSVAAIAAMAQPATNPTTQAQPPAKPTVALERLPPGILLIGIDRAEAYNRVDVATFGALGQAYYTSSTTTAFGSPCSTAKAPIFHKDSTLRPGGLRSGRGHFRRHQSLSIRSARAGPNAQSRSSLLSRGT